jgi:succinoglycan biosynthesis protein ExoA
MQTAAVATHQDNIPFVAVAVPTLNEERYIATTLRVLLAQWPADRCQILVVDGGSSDRTTEIVREMAKEHPNLRLLHNPRRIQSAAMNLAARLADARARILMRADAHADYPPDFIRNCVNAMESSGAASVVVPMRTEGQAGLQYAIAATQNSKLGNGGSAHRRAGESTFVEHGHHAAFDRAAFLSLGGYNEVFTHNEDAEFDHRLVQSGRRIWMETGATMTYYPRSSLESLERQYFRHGRGRARTMLLHGMKPRLRQLLPVAVLASFLYAIVIMPVIPLVLLIPAVYLVACLLWGVVAAIRKRDPWLLAMGPAAVVMHLSWAAGFLRESAFPRYAAGAAAGGTSAGKAGAPASATRPAPTPQIAHEGGIAAATLGSPLPAEREATLSRRAG